MLILSGAVDCAVFDGLFYGCYMQLCYMQFVLHTICVRLLLCLHVVGFIVFVLCVVAVSSSAEC